MLRAAIALLLLTTGCAPSGPTDSAEAPASEEAAASSPSPTESPSASSETPEAGEAPQGPLFTSASELLAGGEPTRYDAVLFYLHGRIIEEEGRRPEHPEYGIYEYDKVLEALAIPGVAVISEARAAGTVPKDYAAGVVEQIGQLLSAGMPPGMITVIGFSKGGFIALETSHQLAHDDVGFVVLATCGSWLDAHPLDLRGRMLSIHEKSDPIGSCKPWVERSSSQPFFHEVEIEIGGSHGAFYEPHDAWLGQTLLWTGAPSARAEMTEPELVSQGE